MSTGYTRRTKYQITVWHENGQRVCRARYNDLTTAKVIAKHNSNVYNVDHVVVKRLSYINGHTTRPYYDLVGAYVNGKYFTRLVWRKMHPFHHAGPGMVELAAKQEADFQKFLAGG